MSVMDGKLSADKHGQGPMGTEQLVDAGENVLSHLVSPEKPSQASTGPGAGVQKSERCGSRPQGGSILGKASFMGE